MSELDNVVAGTVALADGKLVGRIRLQKIIYLMEQKGLNSGAAFDYHHYGPYSEAVSDAISDAKFWGLLDEKMEFRQADGAPYSVFTTRGTVPARLGSLDADTARAMLDKLTIENSTVLELAATVHWLTTKEKISDWRPELRRRKAGKTGAGKLDRALTLLKGLCLAPADA